MKFTFKNFLLVIAALAGVVGFIGAFLVALLISTNIGSISLSTELNFDVVYFGTDLFKGTILPFIGFILLIVGALFSLFAIFAKKGLKKFLNFLAVLLFVVGVVFIILTKTTYLSANSIEDTKGLYSLGIGPILGIIGGGIGFITSGLALFFKK